jgi:NADH:ubiquinone oxidoreductase subunit H
MIRTLYDWLIVPPADLVAYGVAIVLGLGTVLAALLAEFYTVNFLDNTDDGKPRRVTTFIVAALLAFYVFLVIGTAVLHRLPIVLHMVDKEEGD